MNTNHFPYPFLINALKVTNPGKALALELWWAAKCVDQMNHYVVVKKEHTLSARLELMA